MKEFIEKCLEGHDLTADEAARALELIMTNQATDSQIAALLVALRAKVKPKMNLSASYAPCGTTL